MGLQRFYVGQLPVTGCIALDENEARHASSVLRLKENDQVLAFDGCGGEARCRINQISKRAVMLHIDERLDRDCELTRALHLYVALPKGDRQKTLVDNLVQIGVTSLRPLIAQRGVAQPGPSTLVRLSRSVIESSKQCGRNQLMQIFAPGTVSDLVDSEQTETEGEKKVLRLFAHPYGSNTPLRQMAAAGTVVSKILMLIGPEGGFTDEEAEQLRHSGWTAVSLGPRILRVEVAATYAAGWLAESCCTAR